MPGTDDSTVQSELPYPGWTHWRGDGLPVVVVALAMVLAVQVFPSRIAEHLLPPDFVQAYHPGAVSLRGGKGYRDAAGQFITHWPPGFSLLLAPFAQQSAHATYHAARGLAAACAAAWVVALAWLSIRVAPGVSLWVSLPLAVGVPSAVLSNPGLSELPFALLVSAAMCFVLAAWDRRTAGRGGALLRFAVAGLLLGAACLVKGLGVAVLAAVAFALFFVPGPTPTRGRFTAASTLLLAAMVAVFPWLRAYQASTARLGFTTAVFPSVRDGLRRFESMEAGRLLRSESETWRSSVDVARSALRALRSEPLSGTGLVAVKAARVWYATDSGRFAWVLAPLQLPWMFLFLFVVVSTLSAGRGADPAILILSAGVLGIWLAAFLALSIFRYLAPVFPFVPLVALGHLAPPLPRRAMRAAGPSGSR